jgi:hypothetical protein
MVKLTFSLSGSYFFTASGRRVPCTIAAPSSPGGLACGDTPLAALLSDEAGDLLDRFGSYCAPNIEKWVDISPRT